MVSIRRRRRVQSLQHAGPAFVAALVIGLSLVTGSSPSAASVDSGFLLAPPNNHTLAAAPTFADVPFDHPYYIHIEALYPAGFTAGCATDPLRYCPDQTMNRAESAVFVERGIHSTSYSPPAPSSQIFADLPLDSWAAGWVSSLWEDGYTAGCGTDPLIYCPWQGHTRAEGCVFYMRMLNGADFVPETPASPTFTDVPLDAWYAGWVQAAYDAGLISPCQTSPELRFCPNDPLSRGLAAYMMAQAKGLLQPPDPTSAEWTQHGHDAQRSGYTAQVVEAPWRWKWAWNGPNSSGGVSSGKSELPRNVQPITGGGRVYVAASGRGVFALSKPNGSVLWNSSPGGNLDSTPAYDLSSGTLFVGSTNGRLYKLNAADGQMVGEFNAGASISTAPALLRDRVVISAGSRVIALNPNTMQPLWSYEAGSTVHTPPSYSPSRNRVIVATQDLYVHAIDAATGAQVWRVKPTVRQTGDPGDSSDRAEYVYGWPVIAESHGLVLIKARLDWESLWTWAWPTTNAQIRANLEARPDQQALFVLDLDDGSVPFIANIGHGGWGDGGYLPMGPQPVVKRYADGSEVVYTLGRATSTYDGRWDSIYVEMLLDAQTVPGYGPGEVRFINYDWPMGVGDANEFLLTDEQPFLTMAGDFVLGAHWEGTYPVRITDRSASRGSFTNRIATQYLPHIIESARNCPFSTGHYCADTLSQEGRVYPSGFYIYYNVPQVYDAYWTSYAAWVVSDGLVLYRSCDGAIVALEQGNPQSPATVASASGEQTRAVEAQDILNASALKRPPTGAATIPYTDARSHIGETKTVQGELRYIFNNGKAVYLGFKNPHQGELVIRILAPVWSSFPASPETLYKLGQTIRVTGKIEWYQGDPVIYVRGPLQMGLVSGGER